jgi:ABC-type lipoprotein release transport system permease subunit
MNGATDTFEEDPLALAGAGERPIEVRRLSWGARLNLVWEVVTGGLVELWSHKLRSILTLTLLMLGVFALVVLTSVLDGVLDKVGTGFAGMSWDGTVVIQPKTAETTEEQKRFAMSPGLRYEDLSRIAAPHPGALAFLPRATKSTRVRVAGGTERIFVTGLTPDYTLLMNRPIASGRFMRSV